MEDLKAVFAIWGTQTKLAEELGLPFQTVAKWHQRGRIPQEAWGRLIECAARREVLITAADLLRVNNPRQSATVVGEN